MKNNYITCRMCGKGKFIDREAEKNHLFRYCRLRKRAILRLPEAISTIHENTIKWKERYRYLPIS